MTTETDKSGAKKFELWFFRDLTNDQRLSFLSLFGAQTDRLVHKMNGHQRSAMRRVLREVFTVEPADNTETIQARKWRLFESVVDRGWFGIEYEDADNDDDHILFPVRIPQEYVIEIVNAYNSAIERLDRAEKGDTP